jgi:hypothetical protein
MELAPGASFECQGPPRPSAGEVEMSASFEELGLFNGVGTGEGTIHWSSGTELPESEAGDTTSLTHNEIELLFPEIVVWVMIIDGPYAGFRGKLALVDWTRVQDDEGRIVEIVFNPTEVIFSPT